MDVASIHNDITSAGIPINGLSADGRIDFQDSATPEQRVTAQQMLDAFLANPPASYTDTLASGYVDPVTGIHLGGTEHDQTRFTSMVTLIRTGLDLGALTADTPIQLWDLKGGSQTLKITEIQQLLFRYGLWCKTQFDNLAP